MRTIWAAAWLIVLCTTGPSPAHEHADHAGHGGVGTVRFENSCSPAVQADLAQGVAMLHSFWYSAGERTFRAVLARDPGCAIADWGIAALLMSNPLAGVGPTAREAERAQAAIADGRRIGAGTQRERDYIEAVAAYFEGWADRPERTRQANRSAAFEALAARYPGDDEAAIFSALYIAGTQSQADQTYAAYGRAAVILQAQHAKTPDHPGLSHYLIHVYDAPPLAAQGLEAARRYASLAPEAPHALHMPSHIFTRVGAWSESAATNHRAFDAAIPGQEFGEAYHASDYAVYAELQMADDAAALRDVQRAVAIRVNPVPPAAAYAGAAMPARYALERGDWQGAMMLEPRAGIPPHTQAITWFARGLGAARLGEIAAAGQAAAQLETLHQTLLAAGNTYWASEVAVQQKTVAAWILLAQRRVDDALGLMREAADLEDRTEKNIVTPGRMLPARELLGDMLQQAGQPGAALIAYDASQSREPNRLRGLCGAATAAEAAGDHARAASYAGKALAMVAGGAERPELMRIHAIAYR